MTYVVDPSRPCSTVTLCGSGLPLRSGAALRPLTASSAAELASELRSGLISASVMLLRLHLHAGRDHCLEDERRLVEADQQHAVGPEVLHVAGDRGKDVVHVGLRVVRVL